MKRVLLAIAAAFVLVTSYTTIAGIIFVLSGEPYWLVPYLDLPMRIPKKVYFSIVPPGPDVFLGVTSQRHIFLIAVFYVLNVLIYSIPSYIALTAISHW
jgi:hypothetical protein